MNPTGNHKQQGPSKEVPKITLSTEGGANKSSTGDGTNKSSTGDKKEKWVCNGNVRCNDFHCTNGHASGYVRPPECWHAANNPKGCFNCNRMKSSKAGGGASAVSGSKPSNFTETRDCKFGKGCGILGCTFKHPEQTSDSSPVEPTKSLEEEFPSLEGKAVQAQSGEDSAKSASITTFAQMAAKPAAATTSKTSYGVADITAAIEQLKMMAEKLGANNQGPILNWIQLLTQLSGMFNLHDLSTQVGETITAALSFCKAHQDIILKRDKEHEEQLSKAKLNTLFDPLMFEIKTSESDSTNACMAHAFAWSLFHGQNKGLLKRFAMSLGPNQDLGKDFIIDEFMKCFTFIEESTMTFLNLKERMRSMNSIEDFRFFVHQLKEMFQKLETDADIFASQAKGPEQCEAEGPEQCHSALMFFIKTILGRDVNLKQIEKEGLPKLYSNFIQSSEQFEPFFKNLEGLFFDVKSSEHFFNMFVHVMTQRLGKNDAEQLKIGLLSGDKSEGFYTAHLLPLFDKSMTRTKTYLQRTDEAVLESMKSFISMKNSFLEQKFVEFLFSTFDTGGNEGRLTIVKAIDNYLTVLMRYFGIVEDPTDVPFGHRWVMKYKSRVTGENVLEDVSNLIGDYIFDLVSIAKVFFDDKKDLLIPFGNIGVVSVRGVEKKVLTPMSISFLFDEIGKRMTEDRTFGFVKASKCGLEKVPDVFCSTILNKFQNASRGDIMKHFMDSSIKLIVQQSFESKTNQESFLAKVEQVKLNFRVEDSQDNRLLHLFLSMFKRNANDKFQMSLVEFLLHEPCKVALLDSLSFVDKRFPMSELIKSTVSSILRFSTNIDDSHDMSVISAVREAFGFIIQSGITLSEVLDICAVIKELYNANKDRMVFINTFGVALMTAASKTLGLRFETLYSIVTDCLNPKNEIVKNLNTFHKSVQADVSKLFRPSTNFFGSCVKPTPNCESFCRDATSSQVENKDGIDKFTDLANKIFPLIMFSSIYDKAKKTNHLSLSLSDIFDRMSMILIASNRTDVLQMIGLMEMDHMTEQIKKESREEQFLRSVAPSLTTSTLSAYLGSIKRYLQAKSKTIEELLGDAELKALKTQFRMETQLQMLYKFLITSGVLTRDDVEVFNTPEVHSNIFTTNWRGQSVIDIDALSKMISTVFNVSESFVKGIFSIIHRALYPNHKDVVARRRMMNYIFENKMSFLDEQFGQRRCSVQDSSSSQMISFADVAFDFPNIHHKLFLKFMSIIDVSIAQVIQERLAELPVSLMSKKFLDALKAGISMKDVECMTLFAKTMLEDTGVFDFVSCFFSLDAYIETVFYDDEGVDLNDFRTQLIDSSTELSKAFSSYVKASIAEFESN